MPVTRSIKAETAAASACSRRNTVRAVASSLGSRRKYARTRASDCRNIARNDRRDHISGFKWPTSPVSDRYNWSGFYIGLNAGAAFGVNTVAASGGGSSASVREPGFLGGAQVGANYQTGPVVWSFEADYDASTQNKSLPAGALTGSTSQTPWFATVRGRVGMAFDRTGLRNGGRRRRRTAVNCQHSGWHHQHDCDLWHLDGRCRR